MPSISAFLAIIVVIGLWLASTSWAGHASAPYTGEPKGLLTLSIGFGLVFVSARRCRKDTCEVIDIRDRFLANTVSADDDDRLAA